jgi:AcrR family transcriptional regulator
MIPRPELLRGEKLLRGPVQKRSLEKRDRLNTAALALFAEKGFHATSVADIAARARLAVGTFYQHYRTKRQLLLALMDELLEKLSQLNLQPQPATDVRAALRDILTRAFSHDLHFLGAYRAWQEAALTDASLARKELQIHTWTTARVQALFELLHNLPGSRPNVDIAALARVMDTYFWNLLGQATHMPKPEVANHIDAATHLIYHAIFTDRTDTSTS